MILTQYANGLLVVSTDVSKKMSEPLQSFNPPLEELPANPFALAQVAADAEQPAAVTEPVQTDTGESEVDAPETDTTPETSAPVSVEETTPAVVEPAVVEPAVVEPTTETVETTPVAE